MEFAADIRAKRLGSSTSSARFSRQLRHPDDLTSSRTSLPAHFYSRSGSSIRSSRTGPSAARRTLNFEESASSCNTTNVQCYGSSGSGYWQPGETLPLMTTPNLRSNSPDLFVPESPVNSGVHSSATVMDVLQSFQASLDKQLTTVSSQLENIGTRIDKLEARQSSLEEEVRASTSLSSSTSSPAIVGSSSKRKHVTPTVLQSKIRRVHATLDEDAMLKISQPITSPHNIKVVDEIVKSIGTSKFSEDQIRRGCTTYRKTLVGKERGISTPIKAQKQMRSRKQRIYERRAKQVKDREQDYWKQITPDMMSDEEKRGDMFIRHQPSYRSIKLTKFLNKLDKRSAQKITHQPRTNRKLGTPVKKAIPPTCKEWMIKPELRKGRDESVTEPDGDSATESEDEKQSTDTEFVREAD